MTAGVYIVANDRVFDQAIALLSSLRLQDPDIPVYMIPFDSNCQEVWRVLSQDFNVKQFPDLAFLEKLTEDIGNIFPRDFLKLPNKMRKLAAWFGPLENFLYIDTDILCFQPLSETLQYLDQSDFICCDFHAKSKGLKDVFSESIHTQNVFSKQQLDDTFNSGFWGSKKGLFTYEVLLKILKECAANRDYFDFSSGTTDQPLINYLTLKTADRRLNITKINADEPGNWGGSSHFTSRDNILFDGTNRLRYLHWAGTPICPGGPYWNTWEHYRFRISSEPLRNVKKSQRKNFLRKLLEKL
jgi:hypothetical protein